MLITMKNSDLIDKLVVIAGGDIDLVQQAIAACAKGPDGAADLSEVVEYIKTRAQSVRENQAA